MKNQYFIITCTFVKLTLFHVFDFTILSFFVFYGSSASFLVNIMKLSTASWWHGWWEFLTWDTSYRQHDDYSIFESCETQQVMLTQFLLYISRLRPSGEDVEHHDLYPFLWMGHSVCGTWLLRETSTSTSTVHQLLFSLYRSLLRHSWAALSVWLPKGGNKNAFSRLWGWHRSLQAFQRLSDAKGNLYQIKQRILM